MPLVPRRFGFLLVAYLALVGYALVAWMPELVERYEGLAERHPQLAIVYLALIIIGAVILGGISLWILWRIFWNTLGKHRRTTRRAKDPSQMSAGERRSELADNLAASREFAGDVNVSAELRSEIEQAIADLETKHQRQRLEIVAFGTISSGKSSLLNALVGRDVFAADVIGGTTSTRSEVLWPGADEVMLVDTPGLAEVRGESRAAESAAAAKDADLVLLVVDGPLKSYEADLVRVLHGMEKRVLVCLNKEDWYDADAEVALLAQLADQVPGVEQADVVAVRARAVSQQEVRVTADGHEESSIRELPANVSPLAERMLAIVERDGRELLLANLLVRSRGLVDESKERVRAVLDEQAAAIIRRHMWAAGSAAGVNPIPLLDIAGGSAITVKMVLELAKVYRQPIDTDTVVAMLEQLGKNLVAMVGATAATPAVASAVASLLKTVPGIGTLAGGLLQGLVQALVTRWIGNVFVEYYRRDMTPPPGGLAELARDQWQKATRPENLRKLIQAGREELKPDAASDER